MAKRQFKAESKRLMDMMIHSIYTHKDIFLREVISNASDAMDKLSYLSLTDDKVGLNRSDFKITVTPDKENRTLTVSDNGIGMTADELSSNLGVIARSGSSQFKQDMDKTEDVDIIGQFGVGFYSAFMVAKKVTVISKAYGQTEANKWQSSGVDGYTINTCEKDAVGTDIIIELMDDSDDEEYSTYLEDYTLKNIIKKYSDYIRYPIVLGEDTINSMIPIWQRSKSEVSDEDCYAFYKEKYYDTEDPVSVLRVSAEGAAVSYRAMLFIPQNTPYNYYTKEYQSGLQLYSSGVMIMDNCADLLPEHFRFVRGIVDSQDLSLNISRELLQHDRQLKTIASSLEKKIKSELKRLMDKEPEKYDKFYKAFGLQLKYGIVQDYGMKKDLLMELLMFYSEKEEKLISLKSYVDKMTDEQKYIYFASGDSVDKVALLPQTEPVRDAGFDIIYLTDDVDEFVIQMLGKFEEKEFKSVNDDDLGLESEEKRAETEKLEEDNKELLDFVSETLGDEVKEVKFSHKLKSHPVCLSTTGGVSLEMEKYFSQLAKSQGGEGIKADRVLELNADHSAFKALKAAFDSDRDKASKYAQILYYQALLIADLPISNPAKYTELVCELM